MFLLGFLRDLLLPGTGIFKELCLQSILFEIAFFPDCSRWLWPLSSGRRKLRKQSADNKEDRSTRLVFCEMKLFRRASIDIFELLPSVLSATVLSSFETNRLPLHPLPPHMHTPSLSLSLSLSGLTIANTEPVPRGAISVAQLPPGPGQLQPQQSYCR